MTELEVRVADNGDLRRLCFGLRYRVYCEEFRYLPASTFPDGLEKDELDEREDTIILGAFADGCAKGTVRLLLGSRPLPVEAYLDLAAQGVDRRRTAELSRLAVSRTERDKSVSFALFRGVYEAARRLQLTHLCCQNAVGLQGYYRRFGFSSATGPYEHEIFGPSVAMVCQMAGGEERLSKVNPIFLDYLRRTTRVESQQNQEE
jgi:N-acyl-L-homoserine lactone synthetase